MARRVRTQSWSSQALLVAITGWGQESDIAASRDAGFDLHLTKPVDMARLRAALDEHFSGSLPH